MRSTRTSSEINNSFSSATSDQVEESSGVYRAISRLGLQRRGFLDQDDLMEAMDLEEPSTHGEQDQTISQLKLQSRGFLCHDDFMEAMDINQFNSREHRDPNLQRLVGKLGQVLATLERGRRS